jgi:hypothetical protein
MAIALSPELRAAVRIGSFRNSFVCVPGRVNRATSFYHDPGRFGSGRHQAGLEKGEEQPPAGLVRGMSVMLGMTVFLAAGAPENAHGEHDNN